MNTPVLVVNMCVAACAVVGAISIVSMVFQVGRTVADIALPRKGSEAFVYVYNGEHSGKRGTINAVMNDGSCVWVSFVDSQDELISLGAAWVNATDVVRLNRTTPAP